MLSHNWTFLLVGGASLCSAVSGSLIRKNNDFKKATITGFLSFYFLMSFLFAYLLNISFKEPWSPIFITIGGISGIVIACLMLTIGMALKKGPMGLTFAFQNSGALAPAFILALIFPISFGFVITPGNVIGMLLVLIGLFWAAFSKQERTFSKEWFVFVLLAFCLQALILLIYQWRCLLFTENIPPHTLIPFKRSPREDLWFMPAMFFFAWIMQTVYFIAKERRWFRPSELILGGIAGIGNGVATFLLLESTKMASPSQKMVIFPLFAVLIILLTNLYGRIAYKEGANWIANSCCVAGIIIGSLF